MRTVALLLVGAALAAEPIPVATRSGAQHQLLVNGRPFLMLGAQVHNSSGWPSELASVWRQARQLHVNTVEIPVYWEDIEPRPGEFRFDTADALLRGARENGLRLVLLWFATWKNGVMDYAPVWVKENPAQYPRMLDPAGRPVRVLSPHSEANRNADRNAFAALMRHLGQTDAEERTVIMVQVENEPGSLFTVRDHSEIANRLFAGPVPPELTAALRRQAGTWTEVFGSEADEAFAAWHVARYVNAVAEAGKREYPLPLSVNVWLKERKEFMRPGENYPSGGAVTNMLEIWKAAAPAIDVVAPDIYVMDYAGYREVCAAYRRPDNPLLIPETGGSTPFARYMFYAIGDYGAIGWAPFGYNIPGETMSDRLKHVADNFRLLGPAAGKIAALQAAGSLQAAVEEDQLTNVHLVFDRYETVAYFGEVRPSYGGLYAAGTKDRTGRALIGQAAPDEFWVMGFDARVVFRPKAGSDPMEAQFLRVEEGSFEQGEWKVKRILNGDQTFFGLWLPPGGTILRARLMTY